MVLDENAGDDDVSSVFGMRGLYDLWHVLHQSRSLIEVIVQPTPGLRVLPARRAAQMIGTLSVEQQNLLSDAIGDLNPVVDVLLIDSAPTHPLGYSPFGLSANENVVVLSPNQDAIMATYSLIKKIGLAFSRRHFRVLVNKTKNDVNAKLISQNLAELAVKNGLGQVNVVDAIPLDPRWVAAARMSQPVVTYYPEAISALSIRSLASDIMHWPNAKHPSGSIGLFVEQILKVVERVSPLSNRASYAHV